jgi:hypothetical protein
VENKTIYLKLSKGRYLNQQLIEGDREIDIESSHFLSDSLKLTEI